MINMRLSNLISFCVLYAPLTFSLQKIPSNYPPDENTEHATPQNQAVLTFTRMLSIASPTRPINTFTKFVHKPSSPYQQQIVTATKIPLELQSKNVRMVVRITDCNMPNYQYQDDLRFDLFLNDKLRRINSRSLGCKEISEMKQSTEKAQNSQTPIGYEFTFDFPKTKATPTIYAVLASMPSKIGRENPVLATVDILWYFIDKATGKVYRDVATEPSLLMGELAKSVADTNIVTNWLDKMIHYEKQQGNNLGESAGKIEEVQRELDGFVEEYMTKIQTLITKIKELNLIPTPVHQTIPEQLQNKKPHYFHDTIMPYISSKFRKDKDAKTSTQPQESGN